METRPSRFCLPKTGILVRALPRTGVRGRGGDRERDRAYAAVTSSSASSSGGTHSERTVFTRRRKSSSCGGSRM